VAEIQSPRFTLFMEGLNGLAKSFSLREHTNWSKVWEYPWLWFHGLADAVREQNRVVDIGSELSPMPWLMALCGARVTLVERDPQWLPVWEQLRRRLNVEVDWRIVTTEQLPFPDGSANAVTSFSVVEHQTDKRRAVDEIARILKPGGCLAVSFDIAEPSRGMEFPAWNGQALTLDGFEELIWRHPSFASASSPAWNLDDAPSLLQWHVRSAPHHRYVFGAALLRKQP
jgi:SAM-dependent methyltransferase